MKFFASVLTEYARIKLDYIEGFYASPQALNEEGLYDRLNDSGFFNDDFYVKYNAFREEFALPVFRLFEVEQSDWDKVLDFNSRELKVELLKNPGASATHAMLGKTVDGPLDAGEVEALLTVSARTLVYFREMLGSSPQKEALEREGLYRATNIDDLLNFLDLLEIKYQCLELAKVQNAGLKGTQSHKDMERAKTDVLGRIKDLKKNLVDAGNLSPAQEQQIDEFLKANAPLYLIDRVKTLPSRLGQAYNFVADRVLPHQQQLRLDLDYSGCGAHKIAAPTRKTRDIWNDKAPGAPSLDH